jgi:hypothetical protein
VSEWQEQFNAATAALSRDEVATVRALYPHLHSADPTPERLIAIRTELIRLSHCNGDTPERIVARADAYLSFILNGSPKESIVDGED